MPYVYDTAEGESTTSFVLAWCNLLLLILLESEVRYDYVFTSSTTTTFWK